ncbi:unnamed protein product [Ixodes hexagonus]
MCRRLAVCFLVGGIAAALLVGLLHQAPEPFKLNKTGYWGPARIKNVREAPEDDPTIRKFSVHVPDEALVDLKRRLAATKLAQPLEDSRFTYGFNALALKSVLDYWKDKFDWRTQEKLINQFEHYRTAIEGIQVHFMYARPAPAGPQTKVFPLLMTHGWPGSVVEFLKIAPLLTQSRDGIAFELICPSIPGYGFSEAPHKQGFNALETARVWVKLMDRLGRHKFYLQGGDWGAIVARLVATYYPDRVLGVHFNMMDAELGPLALAKLALASWFPSLLYGDKEPAKPFPFPLWPKLRNLLQESGYMHIQATKPDTVGVALLNSPAGLAAYILEKFSTWTRADNRVLDDGGLTTKFSLDELLTNVMVYWLTDSITSSMRYYKENIGNVVFVKNRGTPVTVPCGFAVFPEELMAFPEPLIAPAYPDIVTFTQHSKGGHFPAMEEPGLLERDVRAFVSAVEARNTSRLSAPAPFPFVDAGPLAPKATLTFGPETNLKADASARTRFEPRVVNKEPADAGRTASGTEATADASANAAPPQPVRAPPPKADASTHPPAPKKTVRKQSATATQPPASEKPAQKDTGTATQPPAPKKPAQKGPATATPTPAPKNPAQKGPAIATPPPAPKKPL